MNDMLDTLQAVCVAEQLDEGRDVVEGLQTYERILRESTRLMANKGYTHTTLQDIARAVGIHKSSIFHYFQTKEEILVAILREPIQNVTNAIEEIYDNCECRGIEKLVLAINTHVRLLAHYADAIRVYNRDLSSMLEDNRKVYLEMRRAYERIFVNILEEARDDGWVALQGVNLKIAAYGILGMCNWMVRWYRPDGDMQPEEIARTWVQMILGGGQTDA